MYCVKCIKIHLGLATYIYRFYYQNQHLYVRFYSFRHIRYIYKHKTKLLKPIATIYI